MFPDQKENWLREVTDICTTTLDILNDKVETEGRISTADQVMTDLCMGYLYLLSICNSEGLFTETKIIDKNITLH
jgi:hypothetical protein